MVTQRVIRLAAIMTLALASSCEIASTTLPRTDPMIVVHAILNPVDRVQTVLVEESLTGAKAVVDSGPYNPSNPIVSGNGVPIAGAIVELTTPSGAIVKATEVRSSGGNTTGIYNLDLNAFFIAPNYVQAGQRYTLTVKALGKTVTGSTLVPDAQTAGAPPTVVFNRDKQSVNLSVLGVKQARAFWVRIDAPVSAFSVFTIDPVISISGDTRNLFTEDLIRVFFPGFLQTVTIAAIDSNVYDYYRSGNDPFSGAGLINHLDGGLGVFGSVVIVEKRVLDVTQDPTGDPIEGAYTLRSGGASGTPRNLQLFLESKGPTAESGDRISGAFVRETGPASVRGAIFGRRSGDTVELNLLEAQSTGRVTSIFNGTLRNDTLRTTSSAGIASVYVKVGK